MATIEFEVRLFQNNNEIRQVVPVVDGAPLDQMVASFEQARGFDVAGGCGGLVLDYFEFGDLGAYFLGAIDHRCFSKLRKIALLACGDCGELGCWPLYAVVTTDGDSVTWSEFEQPHRGGHDYTGFGPFVFDGEQYDAAVGRLLTQID